jgi:signal transduction histidine kinase
MVVIEIEDNGIGIPKDVLPHVFEPFFTTKPVGEGTGLGLSVSYGIVRSLGGSILIHSEEGEGTRIIITLPPAKIDTL